MRGNRQEPQMRILESTRLQTNTHLPLRDGNCKKFEKYPDKTADTTDKIQQQRMLRKLRRNCILYKNRQNQNIPRKLLRQCVYKKRKENCKRYRSLLKIVARDYKKLNARNGIKSSKIQDFNKNEVIFLGKPRLDVEYDNTM